MGDSAGIIRDAHRFAPAAPDESIVFGACCPGWHSAASHDRALDQWIEFVRSEGVERVCCLLPGRQLDDHGANVDRYHEAFGPGNVLHAPVPDHHLVGADALRETILPFLDESTRLGRPVVVHCLAGIGRTGQVLAAWLVHDRGMPPEAAVETVAGLGRDPRDAVRRGNATEADLLDLLDGLR